MAEPSRLADEPGEPVARDRPAFGVVATPQSPGAVAAAVLRKHRHDFDTYVYADADPGSEAVEFTRELGATVIDGEADPPGADPRVRLRRAARRDGHPGLIYQADPAERIDVRQSMTAYQESAEYVVDGRAQPAIDARMTTLVAMPAYNEVSTIGGIIAGALSYADRVLVVDDGSTDGTAERAREYGAAVVEHERNEGYGAAIKSAFREAEAAAVEQLVILDADGQHDPADIPRVLGRLRDSEADIVVGSRFAPDSETDLPAYRRVGLRVVNGLTNASLGAVRRRSRVGDTQSGFRAYGRSAIESVARDPGIGDGMGASTDILHHARSRGYRIDEVGVTVDYGVENANSVGPVTHGLHLVANLLRTIEDKHPILILGVPGALLTVVGMGFAYWTMVNFLTSGTFPLGLALTSGVFGLAGVFAAFTAIILHALNRHRRAMGR